jgi:hypothetical protein
MMKKMTAVRVALWHTELRLSRSAMRVRDGD